MRVLSAAKVLAEAAKQGRGVSLTQTYTKRIRNVGTGSGGVSTASESDSTAGGKAKDKGKEIMQEPEPPKKLKKRVQVQMSMDEEIAKKMFEEEQAKVMTKQEQERINLEATLELQRKLNAREEVPAETTQATQAHEIDWNDPSVLRYHAQLNRPYSVAKVWDQTQSFMPMDSEKESKEKAEERMKRKASKAREEKIKRADGNYKTYKFFSEMLNAFDRDDLIVLFKLFNENYASTRPGFDDLMLLGDMKIMFDPDENGEIWKNHNSQELIEWKLYASLKEVSTSTGYTYKNA
ncbi:hypothetical protein Tco_1278262 [Tanacetum coccineum]